MAHCECPLAGYCERHQVKKPSGLHRLCQTRNDYFNLWEEGRGPGQKIRLSETKADRRDAVKARVEKKKRLLGWLSFLRHSTDKGIGDTAHRLNMKSCKHPTAHELLDRLLSQCGCKRVDAVTLLNEEYPY